MTYRTDVSPGLVANVNVIDDLVHAEQIPCIHFRHLPFFFIADQAGKRDNPVVDTDTDLIGMNQRVLSQQQAQRVGNLVVVIGW